MGEGLSSEGRFLGSRQYLEGGMDGRKYPAGNGVPFREPWQRRDDESSSFSTNAGRRRAQSSLQLLLHIATMTALALVSLLSQTSAESCSPGYHAVYADLSSFECQAVSLTRSLKPADYPAFVPSMSFLLSQPFCSAAPPHPTAIFAFTSYALPPSAVNAPSSCVVPHHPHLILSPLG
jgi:hypothetical protein